MNLILPFYDSAEQCNLLLVPKKAILFLLKPIFMKNYALIFLLFSALPIAAQDAYHNDLNAGLQNDYNLPPLTQWILPNTESVTLAGSFNYGSTVSNLVPVGEIFSQARRLTVNQGNNPWDAGHLYRNNTAISVGDKCLFVIWLRSETPLAKVNIFAENSSTYEKEAFASVIIDQNWKMYAIPFAATAAYTLNALSLGLHLAYLNQVIDVGGAACLNYKNTVAFDQLPVLLNNDYYPGIEPDAPWRAEAAAQIEQHRKANLIVEVRDPNGQPLPGAFVHLEMLQHDFKFGTAVVSSLFNGGNAQNDIYQQKLLNLDGAGHGFNEVVFENDLKWPAWEQHWFSSQAEIADDVQWLLDRDISIRGHNLVWPGWAYSPPDLEPNQNDPDYLRSRIRNHLNSILNYPGIGTEMIDWDVLNEITGNNDYANALAGTPGYPTGREIYPEIFRQADSLAPHSVLYLNDYVAIEQGDSPANGIALWKSRINELTAAGAPLEGIGFQGHFGASPTGIPRVWEIYEDFWQTYGLEAKVTEYDINHLVPAHIQAQYMRDILTISFAHPSMKGFLMWGFWDGAHWLGNAPLYREDWSLKPSGEAFIDQVFNQWWTNEIVETPANGTATIRGFKGKYRLRVSCGNTITEQDVLLDGDQTIQVQLLCTTRTRDEDNSPRWWISADPSRELLVVNWKDGQGSGPVQVFNLLGQPMAAAQTTDGNRSFFDTNTWPSGVYLVYTRTEGKPEVQKYLLQR
jgi:GH35 family endo-1,4-beta-xylanase